MAFGIQLALLGVLLIILAVIARRVIMAVMKIGRLKTGEFTLKQPSFPDWEQVLAHPADIRIETWHVGDVPGSVAGIINLKDRETPDIKDDKLTAPLLAHWISHPQYGDFLVDTGFDSVFSQKPWGRFEGMLKKHFNYCVAPGQGVEEILARRGIKPKGVFCTHFHEHQGGAPALPADLPYIFGKGEREMAFFPWIYSRFLSGKSDLREIDFERAEEMPLVGKAVDVFGDGSFWAIATRGHTRGHVSYLVNGTAGRYLLMGDLCMCRKGFELGLESGGRYAADLAENRKSFLKLKNLLDAYPDLHPIFGHESDEFPIHYHTS